MRNKLDRREFLKLSSLFLMSYGLPAILARPGRGSENSDTPNILFIVFDAFSASNTSLYGYQRETTPNLARIAEYATVYHNHYAGGSWTYPGTTSLLTGAYPWTHGGFRHGSEIISLYRKNNLLSLFENYYRVAYTHNPMADRVIRKLKKGLDQYHPWQSLYINMQPWLSALFGKDYEIASLSWERAVEKSEDGFASALFLPSLYNIYRQNFLAQYRDDFPGGLPHFLENFFLLSDAMDWVQEQTKTLPSPYLAYFHFLPPHAPSVPRKEFNDAFAQDGYTPIEKERHFLHSGRSQVQLDRERQSYDEYILNVDAEFGRLYDSLKASGALENTWVVFTSDHGEMFERGIRRHGQPTFHQPIIKVPLLLLEPGQHTRKDIYSPTAAVDLLPTLLHITGQEQPSHLEGQILPPFADGQPQNNRSIFAVDGGTHDSSKPLAVSTVMLAKNGHKLTYYQGYDELPDGRPVFELYDIENDPEELHNIYSQQSALAAELKDELLDTLREKDENYT